MRALGEADAVIPTVMIAGVAADVTASPVDDVAAAIALCAAALSAKPIAAGLLAAASLELDAATRARLVALPREHGEALYAWADAFEIAHLSRVAAPR